MSPDDASAPTPHLLPVDHATLRPCPQCGARQWLQGVTYDQCAPCGYRDGPTPGEIVGQQAGAGGPPARPGEQRGYAVRTRPSQRFAPRVQRVSVAPRHCSHRGSVLVPERWNHAGRGAAVSGGCQHVQRVPKGTYSTEAVIPTTFRYIARRFFARSPPRGVLFLVRCLIWILRHNGACKGCPCKQSASMP